MDEYAEHGEARDDLYQVLRPLLRAKGWMRFLGVMSIIGGVLYCLTIVGAIIGWLPIWIGVLFLRAAGNVETGFDAKDGRAIHDGLDNLRLLFTLQGVLVILGFVLALLYVVGLVVMLATGGLHF